VLLFYLINNCCWNGDKEKNIQENEAYEKSIDPKRCSYSYELVI
jgi:hypothetical protein